MKHTIKLKIKIETDDTEATKEDWAEVFMDTLSDTCPTDITLIEIEHL